MSAIADASAELPYAPAPPVHRRKWFRRAVFSVPLLFFAVFVWMFGPAAWEQARQAYWKRQCQAFTPPAGLVVYDDDPARVPALLAQPQYVGSGFALGTGRLALLELGPWKALESNAAPAVFMHRRTSPSGNDRFVAVQFSGVRADMWRRLTLVPYVEPAASLFSRVRRGRASAPPVNGLMMFRAPGDGTALFAGMPDPADASHFTIDYVHNNVAGTIDGWLNDDDSVTLAPRAGAVARATPGYVWWSPGGAAMPDWIDRQGGTYDVSREPIAPHTLFSNPPIDPSPTPGAAPQ